MFQAKSKKINKQLGSPILEFNLLINLIKISIRRYYEKY